MQESWTVQNNTGGYLLLKKSNIRFTKSKEILDLVSLTNKTVSELERDPEIKLHLAYNNMQTIDKIKMEAEDKALSEKMDALMSMLSGVSTIETQKVITEKAAPVNLEGLTDEMRKLIKEQIGNIKIDGKSGKVESDEEEKFREDAMKRLIDQSKKPDKNFEKLGGEKTIIDEGENFEDLIDF